MSKQLEPKYNHHKVEEGKYRHWIDKNILKLVILAKSRIQLLFPHLM